MKVLVNGIGPGEERFHAQKGWFFWGLKRRRVCRREKRKPLRGLVLKTFAMKIDYQ